MWAGGSVRFPSGGLTLDGRRHVCVEGIRDVSIKGKPGSEKVFVGIERRVAPVKSQDESEQSIRERLWTSTAEEWGDAQLVERRNIVFMHERTPEELQAAADTSKKSPQKKLDPQHKPDFEHSFVPTPSLLFRYSALTLNAHAIHLDPHYCRTVEGHRNLLFHGPLSFTVMTNLLEAHLREQQKGLRVQYIEYRNLAPLYAQEPVKVCGRKLENKKYEVWVETPEGGIAVRGTATTFVDEHYRPQVATES